MDSDAKGFVANPFWRTGKNAITRAYGHDYDNDHLAYREAVEVKPAEAAESSGSSTPSQNQSNSDKPNSDKPNSDKPNSDKPNSDKPNSDKPNSDKPNSDKPNSDKPNSDKPNSDKPNSDKPNTDDPNTEDAPASDKNASDKGKGKARESQQEQYESMITRMIKDLPKNVAMGHDYSVSDRSKQPQKPAHEDVPGPKPENTYFSSAGKGKPWTPLSPSPSPSTQNP